MRIGELAVKLQTAADTIRYYEKEGLLPAPARTGTNYRSYGPAHEDRLMFIRHCRALDMSVAEIRLLLTFSDAPERNCEGVNEVVDSHIAHVAQRIAELQALEKTLKRLRRQCANSSRSAECGILDGLRNRSPAVAAGKARGHVPASHGQ
ncbi:MAG: Cd(II)/Pb(II)-responsive transcriptional regulator [Betaproteobacteria bacterium]|nr:Cd(II)/Pb(II)-responsive transcriptional regulator [Betaproteobacteria bacterium]